MRILVMGQAARGQEAFLDPTHPVPAVDVNGQEVWLPRVVSFLECIQQCGGPHEVFTCDDHLQAVRYLLAYPFDVCFLEGPLGQAVMTWIAVNSAHLSQQPRLCAHGSCANIVAEGCDVRRTERASPEWIATCLA